VLSILGALAKLLKTTVIFAMSVCPSIGMEQLGSHWTNFDEIRYLSCFRKSVEKVLVALKSNNNNVTFDIYDNISLNSS
jgi:hypothetical protein